MIQPDSPNRLIMLCPFRLNLQQNMRIPTTGVVQHRFRPDTPSRIPRLLFVPLGLGKRMPFARLPQIQFLANMWQRFSRRERQPDGLGIQNPKGFVTSSFATYPFNVFRCGVQVSAKRFPMSFGAQCRDASTPSSCRSCALRKLSHRDTQDLDFLHRIEPRGAETAQFTPKIHNFFLFHLGSLYRNHSYMLLVRFSPTLIQLGIQIGYQIYYSDDYTGFVRLLFGIKSGH